MRWLVCVIALLSRSLTIHRTSTGTTANTNASSFRDREREREQESEGLSSSSSKSSARSQSTAGKSLSVASSRLNVNTPSPQNQLLLYLLVLFPQGPNVYPLLALPHRVLHRVFQLQQTVLPRTVRLAKEVVDFIPLRVLDEPLELQLSIYVLRLAMVVI